METQADMVNRFQALFRGMDLDELLNNTDKTRNGSCVLGRVIGYTLGNASGADITIDAVVKGYQEFVMFIEVFNETSSTGSAFRSGLFNVCGLIAALRSRSDIFSHSYYNGIIFMVNAVTTGPDADMRKPDNHGISMVIEKRTEFSFGYPPYDDSLTFLLKRDEPDPTYGISVTGISIELLIRMLMEIRTS